MIAGGASSPPAIASSLEVETYVLDSGMKVYLRQDASAPLVALTLTVGAGSRTEDEWLGSGISHLIEHLVFEGTHQGSPSPLVERIEGYGGEINAFTTQDHTVYYISMPKEWAHVALDVLSESVRKPSFDENTMEREKKVVLHEIQMGRDDPGRILQKLFWRTAFRLHPYRVKTIGHEELLLKLTTEDLKRYYERMYSPENMSLTVVGDFDRGAVRGLIREKFEPFRRRPFPVPVVVQEPAVLSARRALDYGNVQLARFLLGYHTPRFDHPDSVPLDVASVLLGDGRRSRLHQRLQEDLRLTRQIGSTTAALMDSGVFIVSGLLSAEHVGRAEDEILKVIGDVGEGKISAEELDRAKRRILVDYYHQIDTVERQAFWIGILASLAGDPNYMNQYLKSIEAVTVEDVVRTVRKYLVPERRIFCALLPQAGRPPDDGVEQEIAPQALIREKLANGVTVIVEEDHRVPLATFQALFKGGVLAETDRTNGVFQLMSATAVRGTSTRTAEQIFGFVESAGGDLSAYADQNTFGFSMTLPSRSAAEGLNLLSDILREAVFSTDELSKQKDQSLAQLQQIEDTPLSSAVFDLKKAMFPGHPYRFLACGTRESIAGLTRQDVLNAYRRFCRPENLVLSIGGDVQRETMLESVRVVFSNWVVDEKSATAHGSTVAPSGPLDIRRTRKQEQSLVLAGFLGTTAGNPDRYCLELLAEVLSGFGSPLFKKIRRDLGAAYYVGAFGFFGLDPGGFIIYAGTDSDNERRVLAAVEETVEALKHDGISPDDFNRARNKLIAEKVRGFQKLSARAQEAARLEVLGVGYEEVDLFEERIRAISAQDLVRTARKYFTSDRKVTLIVTPEDR